MPGERRRRKGKSQLRLLFLWPGDSLGLFRVLIFDRQLIQQLDDKFLGHLSFEVEVQFLNASIQRPRTKDRSAASHFPPSQRRAGLVVLPGRKLRDDPFDLIDECAPPFIGSSNLAVMSLIVPPN